MRYLIPFLFACTAFAELRPLTLTWTDNADNETGFLLYRRGSAVEPWVVIADINQPDAEIYEEQIDVAGGEHFEWKVTAYGIYGESDPSNIAVLDIPLPPPPPPTTERRVMILLPRP